MTSSVKLPISVKVSYGLADIGINVFVMVKGLIVLDFMVRYLGVPAAFAGLCTSAVLVFDIITDPIVGWLSDRSKSRFGRRAPFMMTGAVLLSILLYFMFAVPANLSPTQSALWLTGFFALSSIAWTMIVIPYGALAVEMTTSSTERSSLMAYRMAGASIGILFAGGLFPALVDFLGKEKADYSLGILMFAPIIILSVGYSVINAVRYKDSGEPSKLGLFDNFSLALQNKQFMLMVLTYGIQTLAIAFITAGIPLAAIYLISAPEGAPIAGAQTLIFICFIIGALFSQPLWLALSKSLGKQKTFILGSAIYVCVLIAIFFLLPVVSFPVFLGIMVLAGISNGCYQQVSWAIMPDLIDITKNEHGVAPEGAFNGLWLTGQKFASALGPVILGNIIGAYGFISTTTGYVEQPSQALYALLVAMTLAPALCLAISIPFYHFQAKPLARQS